MVTEDTIPNKIKGSYAKGRELVIFAMKTMEVNETHIKFAVTHLYEEN